jgi:hypothetical protein
MGEEREDNVESVGVGEDELEMESLGDDNVELAGVDEDEQMESPAFGNADTSTGEGLSGNQKR